MKNQNQPAPSISSTTGGATAGATGGLNRRNAVKRLGLVAGGALALGLAPMTTMAANDPYKSLAPASNRKPSGYNVLLVHGAFADASSWNEVTTLLQREGHNVLAVQNPLSSLADDVAVTRAALATLTGPTVVVGHSYGGAVVTGAATGVANVIGLIYASAFVPDTNESLFDVSSNAAPPAGAAYNVPSYRPGYVWIDPAHFPQVFAADVDPAKARVMAVSQKPIFVNCFSDPSGPAAWHEKPSWYLVSRQDKAINPDLERFMAKRAKATTIEVSSSHASPVSHPVEITALIDAAIRRYRH
jgi:pimeloyl-ACP methyl ester carboxylesterase